MSAPIGPGIYANPVRIVDELTNANGLTVNADGSINTVTTVTPQGYATSTINRIAASLTSVTLIASNTSRKGGYIYNDSTENMYLKLGSSTTSISKTVTIAGSGFYELPQPIYTGIVSAAWAVATGSADVTELT